MMSADKSLRIAEIYGAKCGNDCINAVFAAKDQGEAHKAVVDSLNDAFLAYSPIDQAIAGGFATVIVNILERGRDAIRADAHVCDGEVR